MNKEQVLPVLYDLALVIGGENDPDRLVTRFLHRLLYHTSSPCGLFFSELSDLSADGSLVSARLSEVIGCGRLLDRKGETVTLSASMLEQPDGLFSVDEFFEKSVCRESGYHSGVKLSLGGGDMIVLLGEDLGSPELPLERVLEPVVVNFNKMLRLCRDNAGYMTVLEQELHRRNELESSLRDSELRHRSIFESIIDVVVIINRKGIIESVNPAVVDVLGYAPEELRGKNVSLLMPEPFSREHNTYISRFLETGISSVFGKGRELMACKKDGSIIPVDIDLNMMDVNGRKSFIGVLRDISERKEAERKIIESREAAERANQAKSDFLSSMSHELRTPLNAILGFGQLMEMDAGLSEDAQSDVHEILKAGNHLLGLINEVLDLAKIEAGKIDLSMEPVRVRDILDECYALMAPVAKKDDIQLNAVDYAWSDAVIRADKTRFKQIMLNLLSNAIKYNRKGGQVAVDVQNFGSDEVRISVRDTGLGIREEHVSGLFEAFNRLEVDQASIEGTGIGLVITRRLVELMGGIIGVQSEFGVGSEFWLVMPADVVTEDSLHDHAVEDVIEDQVNTESSILYIEDNPVNIKLVSKLLGKKPGIRLYTAHTPSLGIEIAEMKRPDLVLLDIQLPEMDGYGVLRELKRIQTTAAIPVVALSANAMPGEIRKAEKAGFDDYLTKPLDVRIFFEVLGKYL